MMSTMLPEVFPVNPYLYIVSVTVILISIGFIVENTKQWRNTNMYVIGVGAVFAILPFFLEFGSF
ncbi:hypothetical protein LIS04_156 [Listeria phage LIS04]|nr:hypothetical protein LIS04_156 [Listeria phage LIS04]